MDRIDDWWAENNAPINLVTIGRINFSNHITTAVDSNILNKTLSKKMLMEILEKHHRLKDYYDVGPVQRASVESFVDDIVKYLQSK